MYPVALFVALDPPQTPKAERTSKSEADTSGPPKVQSQLR